MKFNGHSSIQARISKIIEDYNITDINAYLASQIMMVGETLTNSSTLCKIDQIFVKTEEKRESNESSLPAFLMSHILISNCLIDSLAKITFTTLNNAVCSNNLLSVMKSEHFDEVSSLGVLEIENDGGLYEDLVKLSKNSFSSFEGVYI